MVDVEDGVLPGVMHAINLAYARHYNRRYSLWGHVQGWRYGSSRIVDDGDLIRRFAYIANNPVEAGLCAAPADWPWSSYAATIGLAELPTFVDPARILRCFKGGIDPQTALRARVENLIRRVPAV